LPTERRRGSLRGPRLGLPAARRIALAAQGLAVPRPSGRVTRRHLRRAFDTMGLIQIDSVNVVARSQELVLFSRLGAHPRTLLADAADASIAPARAKPSIAIFQAPPSRLNILNQLPSMVFSLIVRD